MFKLKLWIKGDPPSLEGLEECKYICKDKEIKILTTADLTISIDESKDESKKQREYEDESKIKNNGK